MLYEVITINCGQSLSGKVSDFAADPSKYRRKKEHARDDSCSKLKLPDSRGWKKQPCVPALPKPGAAVQCHIFRYEKNKFRNNFV